MHNYNIFGKGLFSENEQCKLVKFRAKSSRGTAVPLAVSLYSRINEYHFNLINTSPDRVHLFQYLIIKIISQITDQFIHEIPLS